MLTEIAARSSSQLPGQHRNISLSEIRLLTVLVLASHDLRSDFLMEKNSHLCMFRFRFLLGVPEGHSQPSQWWSCLLPSNGMITVTAVTMAVTTVALYGYIPEIVSPQ